MNGLSCATKLGRAPWALFGMLGLVAMIELAVARHDLDLTATATSCEWLATGRAARREAVNSEVICLGDSLMKLGVVPKLLQQHLGKRTYNLAVSGGRAPTSYFILRRALDAGTRPDAVLVNFKWTALRTNIRANLRVLPELVGPREHLDLAWTARDSCLLLTLMLSEVLPTFKSRFEVRANILAALQGASTSIRGPIVPWQLNWRKNNGAHLMAKNPSFRGDVNSAPNDFFLNDWSCDPINAIYLERLLKLAASRDIPVFWLITPICPAAQARQEQIGADAAYARFARAVQSRFPNLVVIDGRHAGYHDSVFFDPTHLDRQGAAAFTIDVASVVGRCLRGTPPGMRWIELPVYRDPPVDLAIEDVAQSAIALRQASERIRR
jgi:hypothetical protein